MPLRYRALPSEIDRRIQHRPPLHLFVLPDARRGGGKKAPGAKSTCEDDSLNLVKWYPKGHEGIIDSYGILERCYRDHLMFGTNALRVILVTVVEDGDHVVTVLPVTHTQPAEPALAVEIPAAVKRRLRLDNERSWVVLTEANRFIWPGPDLRPTVAGDPASVAYGPLPFALHEEIRSKFIAVIRARRTSVVPRGE